MAVRKCLSFVHLQLSRFESNVELPVTEHYDSHIVNSVITEKPRQQVSQYLAFTLQDALRQWLQRQVVLEIKACSPVV